jgi:serine protease SohB
MNVLWEVLGFAAKGLIVVVTFALLVGIVFRARGRREAKPEGRLRLKRLDEQLRFSLDTLRMALMLPKDAAKERKRLVKQAKSETIPERRVYVLDFKGDVLASAVSNLRQEVTALLGVAREGDEVVMRLESPGGAVTGYGLAASQLARLKSKSIPLTVCVDKVAASGGYMMACVADRIVAAPFAIIGSIGVAAPTPNVHRLLDRLGIDFENFTGGKYKRTVSVAAPITEEGRKKYQEQIDETHGLFKRFVHEHQPDLAIDEVATGEYWLGTRAQELGLVAELGTSDDYLLNKAAEGAALFQLSYETPGGLRERLVGGGVQIVERSLLRFWSHLQERAIG